MWDFCHLGDDIFPVKRLQRRGGNRDGYSQTKGMPYHANEDDIFNFQNVSMDKSWTVVQGLEQIIVHEKLRS